MRYRYVVTLKRDKGRTIDLISILLCCFSVLNFGYVQSHSDHINYFLLFAGLIVLTGVVINILSTGKGRIVRYKYWLLIAGLGWLGMPYLPWLFAAFLLLAFLESQAKYPLEVGVSGDRVVINTLFKKVYEWSAFNNIVLKDGLLTLDFKNNRLLQREVLDDEEGEADEDEFNAYCQERLREVHKIS